MLFQDFDQVGLSICYYILVYTNARYTVGLVSLQLVLRWDYMGVSGLHQACYIWAHKERVCEGL